MTERGISWERWLVVGVLALLVVVVTLPLVFQLDSMLVGDDRDTDLIGHIWHCWWLGHALFSGKNPYVVDLVLVPGGATDFLAKSGPCLNAWWSVPFQLFFEVRTAYNLSLLGLIFFNGWAMAHLVTWLTHRREAGLVAGALVVFNPFFLVEMGAGRMDQFVIGWSLLYLLYLLRTLTEGGRRNAVWTGVFLALATYSFLANPILLFLLTLVVLGWWFGLERQRFRRQHLVQAGIIVGVFGVLVAPIAVPFAIQSGAARAAQVEAVDFPLLERPHSLAELDNDEQSIVRRSFNPSQRSWFFAFVPVVLALLALGGILAGEGRGRRESDSPGWSRLFLLAAALFLVLALGPYWHQSDSGSERFIPMPLLLVYQLVPFMNRFGAPYRFMAFFWVGGIVLAGLGVAWGLARVRGSAWRSWAAVAGVLVLLLVEAGVREDIDWPGPQTALPVPAFYHDVLSSGEGAVLNVPLAVAKPSPADEARFAEPMWSSLNMLYQPVHQRPIFGGLWVGMQGSPAYRELVRTNGLVRNLLAWQTDPSTPGVAVTAADLAALRAAGYTQVVLSNHWLRADAARHVRAHLEAVLGPPTRGSPEGTQLFSLRLSQ